jgi:dihydrofolate reductase
MRRLIVFNHVSLDGYFVDLHGDMSWAHSSDPEWNAFVQENAAGGGELIFGRATYDLMASYWPTPVALQNDPLVAEHMNSLPKVVFSRTMEKADWNNTRLVRGNIEAEIRMMKTRPGKDMLIFGSGTLVTQLAQAGLIDEYQVIINPVVLGSGKTMFEGLKDRLTLKLVRSRVFNNGNALLCYQPAS